MKNQKIRHLFHCFLLLMLVVPMLAMPAYAEEGSTGGSTAGDIAGVVSGIWNNAAGQIKTICNTVVFPALAVGCGVGFVIAVIVSAVNYKKHHTIEVGWAIAMLVGLLVSLTASTWAWTLVGM